MNRVVVTGLGVLAPNAHGAAEFVEALRGMKSGIRRHERLAELGFACQVGGIPEGVEELRRRYLSEEELLAMNPNMVYAAIAAIDAWEDAGLERPGLDADPDWGAGAFLGTGIGGIDTIAEQLAPRVNAGKVGRLGSTMVERIMSSGNSARVAGLLALGNQVSTNSSACTTGTEAVVQAFLRIREGRAERMLAGGSEGHSPYIWAGFDGMKVLARGRNDDPEGASRPMSATACGFVPAAGAGVLLLESLESARRRGARILAEIVGGHVNCGGHRGGGSMTAPNPMGVRRCIRAAVAMAGIRPDEIGAINGHLTATFADPHEVTSWSAALELPPSRMPWIHSTKSLIGHALGAAGGLECAAAVLELAHGFVHGSANCDDLHPALLPFAARIPHRTVELPELDVVAKASFGFGDVNGCAIFRRYHEE
ncbi:MAG TPA: beta-ketoacyl-[acyl-carrier-protein] synthase family protein [Vulgatibacter sp.]